MFQCRYDGLGDEDAVGVLVDAGELVAVGTQLVGKRVREALHLGEPGHVAQREQRRSTRCLARARPAVRDAFHLNEVGPPAPHERRVLGHLQYSKLLNMTKIYVMYVIYVL